jgi:hypothetical protein
MEYQLHTYIVRHPVILVAMETADLYTLLTIVGEEPLFSNPHKDTGDC